MGPIEATPAVTPIYVEPPRWPHNPNFQPVSTTTMQPNGDDNLTFVDGILFFLIAAVCLVILAMVVRLCYTYMRKFPRKEDADAAEGRMNTLINRHGISMKDTTGGIPKGQRYSVA